MIFINQKIKPVNEVYFGKTPSILAIEKQLDIVRNKYMGKYLFTTKINSDPELIKFNRMMEDQFGFGCFVLSVIAQNTVNAFTLPIDYTIKAVDARSGKAMIVDKNGYRYKKEADYACMVCIYSGLLFNKDFTTEEIMACILHEIGHNFFASMSKPNGVLSNLYMALKCCALIINIMNGQFNSTIKAVFGSSNELIKFSIIIDRAIRENAPIIAFISDVINDINSLGKSIKTEIFNVIRILTSGSLFLTVGIVKALSKMQSFPISLLIDTARYRDELTADNFATMYGYGEASITLQYKFDTYSVDDASVVLRTFNRIPLLSTLLQICETPGMLLITLFDEHPNGAVRCKDQLELLKRELNKADLDPKMRKVIESDIKECEKQLEIMNSYRGKVTDPYFFKKVLFKIMLGKNGDLKQSLLDDPNRLNAYDDRYKEKNR